MRKIENIFLDLPEYSCFGCAPQNKSGHKLEFYFDDNEKVLISRLDEDPMHFQGFPGVLHGGIQATMMDEVGFWVIYDQLKKFAFTLNMNINYKKIIHLPDELTIRAWIKESDEKKVLVSGQIVNRAGEITSEADLLFYIANKKMWQRITGTNEIPELFLDYL